MRKAFLAPWHDLVPQIIGYAYADAAYETGVELHHGTTNITHQHWELTGTQENAPEFYRRAHHDISCALNQLLIEERYDAPGQIFDDRGTHGHVWAWIMPAGSLLSLTWNVVVSAWPAPKADIACRSFSAVDQPPSYSNFSMPSADMPMPELL